jgi:hypothetical protein
MKVAMQLLLAWLIGLGLVATTPAGAAAQRLRFVYRASETANLARHLDCLAELGFCDPDAYREAWKAGWTPEDDAAIAEWKKLVEPYQGHTFDVDRAGERPAAHLQHPSHEHRRGPAILRVKTACRGRAGSEGRA